MSVIGHVDRLLGKLYENDLKHGIITEDEAVSFLEIWLSIQDIRCDSKVSSWADISCTLELGGCDQNGVTVFNRVTELVASVHERLNLINPKLNCRISEDSPEEYLHLISASLLRSHNVIALLNDDTIIPALISSGKELRDARLYVNGGCQETIVEGSEHSAGVMFYFNLPLVLDLSLNKTRRKNLPDAIEKALPTVIESAMDFEDFYNQYFTNMKRALSYAADIRRPFGEQWHKTHPSPAFSATLAGCIESGKDYTAGGAKYNNGTACCIGFATLSDSLLAIKRAVFEDKIITLSELRRALAADFTGYETLRARLVAYPKFGHGDDEADELAARVFDDLNRFTATLDNERGGKYVFSTFTFSHHMVAAPYVGATPDGRLKGEPLSQSTGPSRVRPVTELTDAIRAQSKLPLDKSAGISVLDVMLPSSSSLSVEKLATTLRAFCAYGGQTLQPNRVTRERMIEAKNNPDQHRDLIVRVCGLSVYFVNLSEENKNDMIARNMYVN